MKSITLAVLTFLLLSCSKQDQPKISLPSASEIFITVVIVDPIPTDVTRIELKNVKTEASKTLDITQADFGIKNKSIRLRADSTDGYVHAEIISIYSSKEPKCVPFSVRLTSKETKLILEGLFSTGIKISVDPAWAGESIVRF